MSDPVSDVRATVTVSRVGGQLRQRPDTGGMGEPTRQPTRIPPACLASDLSIDRPYASGPVCTLASAMDKSPAHRTEPVDGPFGVRGLSTTPRRPPTA